MNVNGSRFMLIKGKTDWQRCREQGSPDGRLVHAAYDDAAGWLTLTPLLSLFPQQGRRPALDPGARRGAAADRFGNWYWIAADRRRIMWQASGSKRPSLYWDQSRVAPPTPQGGFGPSQPPQPPIDDLAGLAVTEHHYLVAGSTTRPGLFLFDLHAGGEPAWLPWPENVPFLPFDMAAAPGGGLWILDRANRRYWGLDRAFRLLRSTPSAGSGPLPPPPAFHPLGQAAPTPQAAPIPAGFSLAAADPLAIEALPDGSVLVMDRAPAPGAASTVYHLQLAQTLGVWALAADIDVDVSGSQSDLTHLDVAGYDLAYDAASSTLYVVEEEGVQVIAFGLDLQQASPVQPLAVRRDYLPLHFFGRRGLVAQGGKIYYDVVSGDTTKDAAVRWVQLRAIDQPRYDRATTLLTPVLDSRTRDCTWDRLFLDACIPADASVTVWTRAGNDPDLLANTPFVPEPPLYRRAAGAEIPYFNPFPELDPLPAATGTWELLLQQAQGRYLQMRFDLAGNGRVSPQLRAARAYYPRFSYPRRYLPAAYLEDPTPADFLERWLANPEGFYTEIEGKIRDVSLLFDPRSAPPEALDWLASWLGLVLDPLWARIQAQRQPNGYGPGIVPPDRRRLFIRFTMRLYNQRGTPDGIRFALHLLLDPCLEAALQRFKDAAGRADPLLQAELARFGLPYPEPTMDEAAFDDLLYGYVMASQRPAKVRLVERFLTRNGRAAVAGDPTQQVGSAATAHRFSVLVPEGLSADEAAMVTRIVQLEKPAHTAFDVRRYWDYFRVGEARLGIDTVLGPESRFVPIILGQNIVSAGYLVPAPPMDVRERVILDRDRVGALPPL